MVYFKGLNAFRFIAAALVVLVHLEDATKKLNVGSFHLFPSPNIGGIAVTFFFVLSGFLAVVQMRMIFNFAFVNQFGLKTRQKGREDRNSELMNWMKYRNHPILDHRRNSAF